MEIIELQAECDNMRIDQYLTKKLDYSRSFIQNLIKNDLVTVNEKIIKSNFKLTAGDKIKLNLPEPQPTDIFPENIPLNIIYEDDDIIVVNKNRGMVVHPAAGNYSGTLVNALLASCQNLSGINGEIRPGIVHRLDKDTSGVMVVAKNDRAHIELAKQIKEHTAKRSYYAIVHGNIEEERGSINAAIGRDSKNRLKMAVTLSNSKDAITHFTVIERYGKYTLVECNLETGRTHQIRVHMAYIKHPVVNDPLYGYKAMPFPINGQALHSRTLDLNHPITGEKMHFEAPLPQDFLECMEYARSNR